MTKKEAVQILAILKAAYPSSYNGMTKEEASGTVTVWSMQFADMPVDIVMMAIHKLISTSKFPPTVADVKDKICGIHWEAYTEMTEGMRYKTITEEEQKYYQRIYDLTKNFKGRGSFEPSITQMLNGVHRPQIGMGVNNDGN